MMWRWRGGGQGEGCRYCARLVSNCMGTGNTVVNEGGRGGQGEGCARLVSNCMGTGNTVVNEGGREGDKGRGVGTVPGWCPTVWGQGIQ